MSKFGKLSAIWFALVAVSVIGRLWQPAYGVTPLVGAAIAAGAAFSNPLLAATVPLSALGITNLVLPGYGAAFGGWALAAVVAAALTWPVVLGRLSRGRRGMFVLSALASSLVFFLTTNFACWWLSDMYPHTPAGLLACFVAGLPFHRWMPLGDVAWTLVITAVLARCGVGVGMAPVSSQPAAAA
jgi:hypothetical protein